MKANHVFFSLPQTYSRPVKQLVKYMIDVAMGMHYLAEKGLIHRVSRHMSNHDGLVDKCVCFVLMLFLPLLPPPT